MFSSHHISTMYPWLHVSTMFSSHHISTMKSWIHVSSKFFWHLVSRFYVFSTFCRLLVSLCFVGFQMKFCLPTGKSFDLSAISVGEQQIQARQDSWKLLSSCREQIAGWKLSTFMKVNTERMREKLQLWEKSLQDLTLVLHEGDPILQCVVDSLQDFSQHLPLVQSLLDPAVKHKHWAAIFAVMERPMVGLKTLTLMELLSDPLLKQQDQIHKILLQARAEFSVFQEFGKIQTSWQEKEFCLVRFFLCVSKEDPPPDLSKRPPSGRHWDRARGYSSQDTGTFLLAGE
ncbi:hypothetical protein GDO81_027807, partial [Engystomops pustulosus]